MNKGYCVKDFKNIFLLTLVIGFSLIGKSAFASDNVLQAIQIDGVKDSYNIVLRSDDTAELKKTIQAPNKMTLTLKGIRASKSINTIYNNTADVDSVVVEPTGNDAVKILIQADNVQDANIQFDTLKTPLGVLDKSSKSNNNEELILNKPMESYKPVYDETSQEEDASGISLSSLMAGSTATNIKKALKNDKITWMITFGLLSIILLGGIKLVKGKDNEIKVGLSQSLKERELNLYRSNMGSSLSEALNNGVKPSMQPQQAVGNNYGLRAYQNGTRSPYVSSEIQRPRPAAAPMPQKASYESIQKTQSQISNTKAAMQNTIQKQATAPASRPKTTNIDSMKFLESMTKIYEKNGRSDLAQELKSNMKKAKINIA